jgi:hypothetical protein
MRRRSQDKATDGISGQVPAPRARPDWSWWIGVGAIALVGLGIRIGAVVGRPNRKPGGDAFYYHYAANFLVNGLGWIDPIHYYFSHERIQMAEWPPLFVGMLAVSSLVGFKTYFAHRIWSGVIGTAAVVVCGIAGRQIAGRRVGLCTAAVIALYPNIWMSDEPGLSETITPLLIGLVLWAAYRFWKRPTLVTGAVLSGCVAITALGRDELSLLFVLLIVPIILFARTVSIRRRLAILGVSILAAVVVLGPWVGYNLSRFQKPVFITTGLGVTLASSNCAATWNGEFAGYWQIQCALAVPLNTHADESVQDAEAESYAWHFIVTHKSEWVRAALDKVGRGFGFFRPAQQITADYYVEGRPYHWAWVGLYTYYVLFALSIPGAVILFRRRTTLLPLVAVTLNVIIAMIITFGQTRYRTPFEVVLAVLASVTLDAVLRALFSARRARARRPLAEGVRDERAVPVAV